LILGFWGSVEKMSEISESKETKGTAVPTKKIT